MLRYKHIFLGLFLFFINVQAQEVYTTLKVTAEQKANLAFDASGIVKKVNVNVSSAVKKGDILAELKNDDVKASLRIAQASVQSAQAILKFAKRDYDRQVLIKELIDEAKFDVYALAYEKAKAGLSHAEANLAYQEAMLAKTRLRAPFDGIIYEKSLEIGDVVNGMMLRTVFKIQSPTQRKLILSFDQKYWKDVKTGQKFRYAIDGDETIYHGKISRVYPSASDQNRKIQAEVKAKNFTVGLIGEGYIIIPDKQ